MDTPCSLDPEKLDANLARAIDTACRAFEKAWQSGQAPQIEDHLEVVPERGRRARYRSIWRRSA